MLSPAISRFHQGSACSEPCNRWRPQVLAACITQGNEERQRVGMHFFLGRLVHWVVNVLKGTQIHDRLDKAHVLCIRPC